MKTQQEIKEWLESQEWFDAFKRNIMTETESEDYLNEILSGDYLEGTIFAAFLWREAPEGRSFWIYKNREFLEWYNN